MVDHELPSAADYATLGKALLALRTAAGLRQEDAAAIVGIRATFISTIENGHRGCRFHTLLALLRAYDTDLHGLARAFDAAQAD